MALLDAIVEGVSATPPCRENLDPLDTLDPLEPLTPNPSPRGGERGVSLAAQSSATYFLPTAIGTENCVFSHFNCNVPLDCPFSNAMTIVN